MNGININAGFNVGAPVALDARTVLTKAEMLAMNDNVMPDVYQATCKDDGAIYIYNKANEANETTGKFRKLTFDGVDRMPDDVPSNCEVGGILPGDVVAAETPVTEVIAMLLTKYYPATVSLTADCPVVVKKGTTLDTVTLTADIEKKSNPIVEVTFTAGEETSTVTEDVADGGEITYTTTNSITEDTTFSVTVNDGKKTTTDTTTVTFVDPIYYGTNATVDITSTEALTELVEIPGNKTVKYTADNEYLVFLTTADIVSIKDVNGFENINSFNKYEELLGDTTYNLYISATPITATDYQYTFFI